jgi:hypothetical protein
MSEAESRTEPAPVYLRRHTSRKAADGRKLAKVEFWLNVHDFDLRHLRPKVQEAYRMREANPK